MSSRIPKNNESEGNFSFSLPKRKYESIDKRNLQKSILDFEREDEGSVDNWMWSIKTFKTRYIEQMDDFIIFSEEVIEKYREELPCLKSYTSDYDESRGLITIIFHLCKKPSMEERRILARVQVLILEDIDFQRVEFQKEYM